MTLFRLDGFQMEKAVGAGQLSKLPFGFVEEFF